VFEAGAPAAARLSGNTTIKFKQEKFVAAIKQASTAEVVHEQSDVDNVEHNVAMLELLYDQLSFWAHGWQKHDIGWKRLVTDKMKELGQEVSDEHITILQAAADAYQQIHLLNHGLEGEIAGDLAAQRGEVNAQLAALMEKSDRKIAEILANEDLNEEQKQAAIAKVHEETQAEAGRIYGEQANIENNKQALESNLYKYANMVDEAWTATERARGRGVLTSKADDFVEKMKGVHRKLQTVKNMNFLPESLMEEESAQMDMSDEQRTFAGEGLVSKESLKEKLRLKDDELEAENKQMEEQIAQLKKYLDSD